MSDPAAMTGRKRQTSDAVEAFEALVPHLRVIVPAVVLGAAIVVGVVLGVPSAVLVLTGGALLAVIAIFWSSVRTLVGETPLSGADAYALGAPRQEEERKQAMLRALKDLEFERSVGKISEEDFQVLNRRYREEAKRLLRLLDEEALPRRRRAEELLESRLQAEARGDAKPSRRERLAQRGEPAASPPKTSPAATVGVSSAHVACPACDTHNDTDAAFCKKCGGRLGPASATEPKRPARKKSRRASKRGKTPS